VLSRDDEGVTLRDRVAVSEGERVLVLQRDAIRRYSAERASVQGGRITPGTKW